MGAPSWDLRNRGAAVLASGVVVAMTALNVGLAPATADPGDGPGSPTTTVVVPEPEVAEPETAVAEKPSVVESAPAAPSTATAPVEQAPETQAQTPETQAPKPSQTQAPTPPTTMAAPTTSVAPPASREAAPATTKSTTKPTTKSSEESSEKPAPETSQPETTKSAPSPALAPATTTSPTEPAAPAEKSGDTATAATTPTSPTTESESSPAATAPVDEPSEPEPATSRVSQAAREIEPVEPATVEAPAPDVEIAKAAKVVEQPEPVAADVADVAAIARIIDVPVLNGERRDDPLRANDVVRLAGAWDRNVRQWSPDWVQYDDYYRPVFANPYRDPVKIIYVYQNAPRMLTIPPLSRIVLEVAQYAAYSFTAVVMNAVNTAVNVAVGSFFGGGFFPGVGLPLPPPPPPLLRYDNVPVFVNYSQQRYEPFRVQRIIDVGNDARYGERKVLLDGVTPAWGQWTQTAAGERQFEVHRTQQFPGLDEPREAPLPGDYNLRLASDDSGGGFTRRDVYLTAVAILCAVLSAGAVMLSVAIGRRRNA